MEKRDYKSLIGISKNVRKHILRMTFVSKSSHIGSALSTVEILTALYFRILKIDPQNPGDNKRDRFILSKGHASAALYSVMAERGFFPVEQLDKYYIDGGCLPGHLDLNCPASPGVEASTGSLGHGLPIGLGMALAARMDNTGSKTYVVLSDGECNEGTVWEAAMLAGHLKLDNLIVIIDYNKIQSFGRVKEVLDLEPFAAKWKAFRWAAKEVDGHSFKELIDAFESVPFEKGMPSVIIAHTVKGKGVSFMEDRLEWHYKSPAKEQYDQAVKEVERG